MRLIYNCQFIHNYLAIICVYLVKISTISEPEVMHLHITYKSKSLHSAFARTLQVRTYIYRGPEGVKNQAYSCCF